MTTRLVNVECVNRQDCNCDTLFSLVYYVVATKADDDFYRDTRKKGTFSRA